MRRILLLTLLISFNFINSQDNCLYNYSALITEVYDGDTVTAKINLGFNITIEEKIRLYGINTPEVRGVERPEGLISRDSLRAKILNKIVIIQTLKDKKGKYGRYIGKIFYQNESINDWLVTKHLAIYHNY